MSEFDIKAGQWDEKPGRVQFALAIAEAIRQHLPLHPDMRVMEFGCGTGLIGIALADQVKHVLGLDTSAGMIQVLQEKIRNQKIENITAKRIHPNQSWPVDEPLDLICSSMVLHHVENYQAVLERFRRHLRPGGYLALADLDRENGSFHDHNAEIFHAGFDRQALMQILVNIGFEQFQDSTAFVIPRPDPQGNERNYPVFLITARKATS